MDDIYLEFINIEYKRNDASIFSGISFSLHEGEALLIEGCNGSGKTTFLKVILGLYLISSGNILYKGSPLNKNKGLFYSDSLYIGHNTGVVEGLTVKENIKYFLLLSNTKFNDVKVESTLRLLNIFEYENTLASKLSQGQRYRILISRLLLCPAKVWILDEPFTSLDKEGVSLLTNEINCHLTKGGIVIVTSHCIMNIQSTRNIRLRL